MLCISLRRHASTVVMRKCQRYNSADVIGMRNEKLNLRFSRSSKQMFAKGGKCCDFFLIQIVRSECKSLFNTDYCSLQNSFTIDDVEMSSYEVAINLQPYSYQTHKCCIMLCSCCETYKIPLKHNSKISSSKQDYR